MDFSGIENKLPNKTKQTKQTPIGVIGSPSNLHPTSSVLLVVVEAVVRFAVLVDCWLMPKCKGMLDTLDVGVDLFIFGFWKSCRFFSSKKLIFILFYFIC